MDELIHELCEEIDRVNDVLAKYYEIGPPGLEVIGYIQQELDKANFAIVCEDWDAMENAILELRMLE